MRDKAKLLKIPQLKRKDERVATPTTTDLKRFEESKNYVWKEKEEIKTLNMSSSNT